MLFFTITVYADAEKATGIIKRGETISLPVPDDGSVLVETVGALKSNGSRQGLSGNAWGVTWYTDAADTCRLVMSWGNTDFGTISDRRFVRLQLLINGEICYSEDVFEGIDLYKGANFLKLLIADDGDISWNAGSRGLAVNGTAHLNNKLSRSNGIEIFTIGSDLNIMQTDVSSYNRSPALIETSYTTRSFFPEDADIQSSAEGVWLFLDRDNDPKWARPGGRYELGIRKSDTNPTVLDIIYLDGAVTNAGRWKPGMIKGHLTATPFKGHYNMEWTDSLFDTLDATDECSASLSSDGAILTLNFPLDHASMRFYRNN